MGVFYTETLLPRLQRWHTYVSLHDVYNPLFWTDAAPTRDMSIYPPDMPNREGAIVLDWLAYPHLADACGLFTAAPAKRPTPAKSRLPAPPAPAPPAGARGAAEAKAEGAARGRARPGANPRGGAPKVTFGGEARPARR